MNKLRRLILLFTAIYANETCEIEFGYFNQLIALNSYPGSGNTWVRSLIEKAFGYYTGSVYMDTKLYEGGFLGEYTQPFSGHTIMQKIHHNRRDKLSSSYFQHTENCVSLFRAPKEAILAEFKRTHVDLSQIQGADAAGVDKHTFDSEVDPAKFKKYFANKYDSYFTDIALFLNKCENNHIILFDNLKEKPILEMEKLAKFLNKIFREPLKDKSLRNGIPFKVRKSCLQADTEGKFHRKSDKSEADKYAMYKEIDWLSRVKFNKDVEKIIEPLFYEKTGINWPAHYRMDTNDHL